MKDHVQNEVGTRIAARRREMNLTQKELADRLGVTPQALSQYERGSRLPDAELLARNINGGIKMNRELFFQAIAKFIMGVLLVAILLFLPAGSFAYWNAWLFIGILFVPMFGAGIVLMIKNPELLKKRLNVKEKENQQKEVVALSGIMFIAGFALAGLGYRFHWFMLPKVVCIAAGIIFLAAYALYAEVLRENTYLSRTVEVQEDQKVIDTGLYGVVRHPMYAVTVLLFLSIPLLLGSIFSFAVFCVYPFILAKRIQNEEEVLTKELEGYDTYKEKVKYRMIPFVW